MNDTALLSAVESLRTPDSAVYTLTREKKRPFLLDLLDVVVTSGLFNSGADVADNLRSSYVLVADRSRARSLDSRTGRRPRCSRYPRGGLNGATRSRR